MIRAGSHGIKTSAISCYDFTGAGRIVDVGGADGAVLAHILAAAPATTGVVFDLPHVVAEAEPRLARFGMGLLAFELVVPRAAGRTWPR